MVDRVDGLGGVCSAAARLQHVTTKRPMEPYLLDETDDIPLPTPSSTDAPEDEDEEEEEEDEEEELPANGGSKRRLMTPPLAPALAEREGARWKSGEASAR